VCELKKLGIASCKESLAEARRSGINITQEIKACTWQVVCVDPEHLDGKEWRNISESEEFCVRLLYFSIDEAHLINEFCTPLGQLARSTSLAALSATLAPGSPTTSVCISLSLANSKYLIRHTNERPNVQFIMKTLTHGLADDFPDLLPFLNSGRKVVIHCATIELVFRV
ncbi:hypothetical protein C8R45DRAFT_1130620, partial [Mycena sanguinolenta]